MVGLDRHKLRRQTFRLAEARDQMPRESLPTQLFTPITGILWTHRQTRPCKATLPVTLRLSSCFNSTLHLLHNPDRSCAVSGEIKEEKWGVTSSRQPILSMISTTFEKLPEFIYLLYCCFITRLWSPVKNAEPKFASRIEERKRSLHS